MTQRYLLQVYVCGPSKTEPSPFEGWASFDDIFCCRPNGARYAVALGDDAEYRVWDFYDNDLVRRAAQTRMAGSLRPPRSLRRGRSLDALVVATMVFYDRAD